MSWAELGEFAIKHWLTVVFGLVSAGLTAAYRRLSSRVKKDRSAIKAMQAGVEALLADRMIYLHNYYQDKGCCPIYAKRSAETMYTAYHNLGGNGTVTELYNRLLAMPTEKKEG